MRGRSNNRGNSDRSRSNNRSVNNNIYNNTTYQRGYNPILTTSLIAAPLMAGVLSKPNTTNIYNQYPVEQSNNINPEYFLQLVKNNDINSVALYPYYSNIRINDISPLLIAYNNRNINMMNLLLSNGADINAKYNGYSLLMDAIIVKDNNMINYLIDKGANNNDPDVVKLL